jgi:hypothetical protein
MSSRRRTTNPRVSTAPHGSQLARRWRRRSKTFDARLLAHAANDDISFSEWEYNLELEGVGAHTMIQVAVRRWKDGKIDRERFHRT